MGDVKMFIDYVPLMLVNMMAGLVLVAWYVYSGLEGSPEEQKRWAAGLGVVGLVAMATGLHMIFTWPLPSVYNVTHGELTVLFGAVYLGAAFAIGKGWNPGPVTVYAFFAGLAAVVVGVRVIELGLTLSPRLSGAGFILTGLAGVFSGPTLFLRKNRLWRVTAVGVLLATAGLWGLVGYGAYWDHLKGFAKWTPATMRAVEKK
jgi:putative membrane protein